MPRLEILSRLFLVESARALARNRLRSILTTTSIAIGVAAVIFAVAIGDAGTARAKDDLAQLGDALVGVEAGSRNVNGLRTGTHVAVTPTPEDADAIRREIPLVKMVAENLDGGVQAVSGEANWATRYRGVGADYAAIRSWKVMKGSFFDDAQVQATESVAVLVRGSGPAGLLLMVPLSRPSRRPGRSGPELESACTLAQTRGEPMKASNGGV
jgi:putative ABC transport system permease protein